MKSKNKKNIVKTYDLSSLDYFNQRERKIGTSYFYNELVETPTVMNILGNIKGKKILDLGCGPGFYLEKLKKKGAILKGVDFSKELVKLAKLKNPEIEILKKDITKKLPYKDSEFDIVISTLVMGHIEKWELVLKEIKRILKKNGLFVFSIGNPFLGSKDKLIVNGKNFRIPKDYFQERAIKTNWGTHYKKKNKKNCIIHYHKTQGTIIKILVKNGFEIIDYEDCKPLKKSKKLFPEKYEREINFPSFCVWKCIKK